MLALIFTFLTVVHAVVFLDCLDCSGDPLVIAPCKSDTVEGQCFEMTDNDECPEGSTLCFPDGYECEFATRGGTWDFSGLAPVKHGEHADPVYNVTQSDGTIYFFEFCGVVYPQQTGVEECLETESGSGPAPAFKVFTNDDGEVECHRLGDANIVENSMWMSFNPADPIDGVSLMYLNGDSCGEDEEERESFEIRFECANSVNAALHPDPSNSTDECTNRVGLQTILGCPEECRSQNFQLCNSEGGCGIMAAQEEGEEDMVFCDCADGWKGEKCEDVNPRLECEFMYGNATWKMARSDELLKFETDDEKRHYFFRICNLVHPSETNYPECDGPESPAFLVRHMEDGSQTCERLGYSQLFETEAMWELLVPEEPEAGVILTYIHGDECEEDGSTKSLSLRFKCSNNPGLTAGFNEFPEQDEDESCHYTLSIASVDGCPTECVSKDDHLCNSKGGCMFDEETMQASCTCEGDDRFQGSACEDRIDFNCTFEIEGAHWDLSGERRLGNNAQYHYENEMGDMFNFQICGELTPDSDCTETSTDMAPAFKKSGEGDDAVCERLGGPNLIHGDGHFELLNMNDPIDGIVLVYENGDPCSNDDQQSKSLRINYECSNGADDFHDHPTPMEEEDMEICTYVLARRSHLGCPDECISDSSEICSGRGSCKYDLENMGGAYCECTGGGTGPKCETETPEEEEMVEMFPDFDCTFAYDDAMWNFTGLNADERINGDPYRFYDPTTDTEFIFNICGLVQPGQVEYEECSVTEGRDGPSPAFMVTNSQDEETRMCHRLGNSDLRRYARFFLLEEGHPEGGVILEYTNGDICERGGAEEGNVKSFQIRFECIDQLSPSFHSDNVADGDTDCDFAVGLRSFVGCPLNCLSANSHLCNSEGGCAYNPRQKTHCDCAEGWTGPTCEDEIMITEEGQEMTTVTQPPRTQPPHIPVTFPQTSAGTQPPTLGESSIVIGWNDSPECPPEFAITVSQLDIVEWQFSDLQQHSVKCMPEPCFIPSYSGMMSRGSFLYKFSNSAPGPFGFFCELHGSDCMRGNVFVLNDKPLITENSPTAISDWEGDWKLNNACDATRCCCLRNGFSIETINQDSIDVSVTAHGRCVGQEPGTEQVKFRVQSTMMNAYQVHVFGNTYTLSMDNKKIDVSSTTAQCAQTAVQGSFDAGTSSDVVVPIVIAITLILMTVLGVWLCCFYYKKKNDDPSQVRLVSVGPQHQEQYAPLDSNF